MILKEVDHPQTATEFLDVARELYRNDKFWVCPLDKDIKAIFDPKLNNFNSHGSCTRWVLKSDDGKLIGIFYPKFLLDPLCCSTIINIS